MYVGVLPFAEVKGSRIFLLGLENAEHYFDSHNSWCDFGGAAHSTNVLRSAAEEFYEESMGMFGSVAEIEQLLTKYGKLIKLSGGAGYTYLLRIRYEPAVTEAWNRIWKYISASAKSIDGKLRVLTCPEGYLEKQRLGWFSERVLRAALNGKPTPNVRFRREFLQSLRQILAEHPHPTHAPPLPRPRPKPTKPPNRINRRRKGKKRLKKK
jgi:hypothetical protein